MGERKQVGKLNTFSNTGFTELICFSIRGIISSVTSVFAVLSVLICLLSCRPTCHIQGVVGSDQYEGKRVYLVPVTGPATAETVDSVEIKDCKFEFSTDLMQMYKIVLGYRYRMGIQPLLVVGEPGEVKVVIDSVSHAGGTPQNDSLEQWKIRTEQHNRQMAELRMKMNQLSQSGDQQMVETLKQRGDSIHLAYKEMTMQMAGNLKEGILHDFLSSLFLLNEE